MSTPIKRENIRKGDRVRMVVTSEFTAACDLTASDLDEGDTETYELIERPVVLPTVPGLYLDKHSDVWQLTAPNGRWFCMADTKYDYREAEFAPFTLLRPVAEVAAEVLAELHLDELASSGLYTRKYYGRELHAIAAKFGVNK